MKNDGIIAALYIALIVWVFALGLSTLPSFNQTQSNVESFVKAVKQ